MPPSFPPAHTARSVAGVGYLPFTFKTLLTGEQPRVKDDFEKFAPFKKSWDAVSRAGAAQRGVGEVGAQRRGAAAGGAAPRRPRCRRAVRLRVVRHA
jgi:hypothetical protein